MSLNTLSFSTLHSEKHTFDLFLFPLGTHVKPLLLEHSMTSDSDYTFISELQFLAKGLEDNLEPRDIIDDLLVSGFLSFIDHEDIYTIPSRHMRVKTLVDHVKRSGRKNFSLFETALKSSYPELANELKNKQLANILPRMCSSWIVL